MNICMEIFLDFSTNIKGVDFQDFDIDLIFMVVTDQPNFSE